MCTPTCVDGVTGARGWEVGVVLRDKSRDLVKTRLPRPFAQCLDFILCVPGAK